MKMKKLSLFLFFVATTFLYAHQLPETLWNDIAQTDWYDESATLFELATAGDLAGLPVFVADGNDSTGKTIKLSNNINLSGNLWQSVGPEITASFSGIFDGDGYTISNLTVNQPEDDFVGFFGSVL